jgi:hypothetical protein
MKNINKYLFFSFLISSLFVLNQSVNACSCSNRGAPICATFTGAEVVFIGRIVKFQKPTKTEIESSDYDDSQKVFFEVEKSLKGTNSKIVIVSTDYRTSCTYQNIAVGQKWVVFASRRGEAQKLSFGMCGGSYKIAENANLNEISREIVPPTNGQTIYGKLAYGGYRHIKNILVTAERFNQKYSTRTDKNGLYEISVPFPGKYKVQIEMPYSAGLFDPIESPVVEKLMTANRSLFEYDVEMETSTCKYREFKVLRFPHADANASISGNILNLKQVNYPKPDLFLYRVGLTEQETLQNLVDVQKINDDGSFAFNKLGKDSYVILMNQDGFPTEYKPFLKTYLPNVNEFSLAQIFRLEKGQAYSDLKINLPKPLEMSTISGTISAPDGKPVIDMIGKSGNGLDIKLYNLQNTEVGDSWGSCEFDEGKFDCHGPIKMDRKGNFKVIVFDGNRYLIIVDVEHKKRNEVHGFAHFEGSDKTKAIKIIVDKVGNSDANESLKRLLQSGNQHR